MSMPSFTLELDTTPPQVEFDLPRWHETGDLVVTYSLSEPEITSAEFDGEPLDISGGQFLIAPRNKPGLVIFQTEDDVLNAETWELNIPATATYDEPPDASYEDGGGSTYEDGGPATYDG